MVNYDEVASAVHQAKEDREFQRRMAELPNQIAKDSVKAVAGTAVVGAAVGAGMFFNEKFKYFVQALLHFPMAFFVVGFASAVIDHGIDSTDLLRNALIGSLIWTALYIILRTIPKWRNA